MTPREVCDLPVIETGGLNDMVNGECWPLFPERSCWGPAVEIPGLEVRTHGIVRHDARRDWVVFSVWFEDKPVAVARAAGRERDDAYDRWIIDEAGYRSLAAAVRAAISEGDWDIESVSPDTDIGDVLCFYGETVEPGRRLDRGW